MHDQGWLHMQHYYVLRCTVWDFCIEIAVHVGVCCTGCRVCVDVCIWATAQAHSMRNAQSVQRDRQRGCRLQVHTKQPHV